MEVDKQLLYSDYVYRQNTAKRLLIFSDEALKGGDYFKHFKKYKNIFENEDFENEELNLFYLNYLFENLRITTFFENFVKAFLLLNNKVVHIVNRDKDKNLNKIQKTSPIEINENLNIEILGYNTIGTSYLRETNYCHEIGLDIEFIKLLNPIFEYRNKVHFYVGESISNPKNFIELYERILSYSAKNVDPVIRQIEKVMSDLIMLKKSTS